MPLGNFSHYLLVIPPTISNVILLLQQTSQSMKAATKKHDASVLDASFSQITQDMDDDPSHIWNTVDLHYLSLNYDGSQLTHCTLNCLNCKVILARIY